MGEEVQPQPSNSVEPISGGDLDWNWPTADVLTDDSIPPRIAQTCSELGSKRIRLIRILPGCSGDTIECETRVCFLSQAEEYTALSYAWGSPAARCHIIMDGQPRRITTNLLHFLRQAKYHRRRFPGWLWIDALSIDQTNPWEKLEQVKIISSIFESAERAVIWLGPSYGDSDKAMKALATIAPGRPWRSLRALYAPPLQPALLNLCDRAYWRRLWVFQELKCSREIVLTCGDRLIDFEHLKRFLLTDNVDERVQRYAKESLHQSFAAEMIKLVDKDLDTSLRSMLDATSHLECTDTRDKIYAILKVVSSGHQDIEADYTITSSKLINKILYNMHLVEEPTRLSIVGQQCSILADRCGVDLNLVFGEDMVTAGSEVQITPMYGEVEFPESLCESNPLDQLDRVLVFLCREDSGQLENVMTLISKVHAWCKEHNHWKIGALVQKVLCERRDSHEEYAYGMGLGHSLLNMWLLEGLRKMINTFDDVREELMG